MPRPRSLKPRYCLDKPSGRAFVALAGKRVYLGHWNSQSSRDLYDRLVGEWIARGRPRAVIDDDNEGPTVTQIIIAFWAAAKSMYPAPAQAEGKRPSGELGNYFDALKPLRRLYGPTPAREFGPLRLKALREAMVKLGWCRSYVNRQVDRIKRVFKWAVGEELLPGELYHRLRAVEALRIGRTEAPESEPVEPVASESVKAALPFVSRQVRAMIELQQLTGMRPGEVCAMRLGEIDRTSELWIYKPAKHKSAHHGHERVIYLGPKAQQILAPFLTLDPNRYLFSPADAEAERRDKLHVARKTPASCGNVPGSNCQSKPQRSPGGCYTVASYRRAIRRACELSIAPPQHLARLRIKIAAKRSRWETLGEWRLRLGTERWAELVAWRREQRWHPHQLRHTAATELRKEFGLEAAQVVLGHKTLKVTEIYAQKNLAAAQRIMQQIG